MPTRLGRLTSRATHALLALSLLSACAPAPAPATRPQPSAPPPAPTSSAPPPQTPYESRPGGQGSIKGYFEGGRYVNLEALAEPAFRKADDCYIYSLEALPRPTRGQLFVDVTVAADGRVTRTASRLQSGDLHPNVIGCAEAALRELVFPPPPMAPWTTTLHLDFNFSSTRTEIDVDDQKRFESLVPEANACAQPEWAKKAFSGRIALTLFLFPTGAVESVEATTTGEVPASVVACVKAMVAKHTYKASPKARRLTTSYGW